MSPSITSPSITSLSTASLSTASRRTGCRVDVTTPAPPAKLAVENRLAEWIAMWITACVGTFSKRKLVPTGNRGLCRGRPDD